MADTVEHSWDGGSPDELVKQFEKFEKELDRQLRDAMNRVVKKIAGDAAEKAPYDTGYLSSHVRGRVVGIMNEVLKGIVGTNVDYGLYQEEGTRDMEANPYLEPAIEENREWAGRQFEQAVEKAAERTLE